MENEGVENFWHTKCIYKKIGSKKKVYSHMFCRAMDSRRSVIDGSEDTDDKG